MKRKVLQKRLLVAAMTGALALTNAGMPTLAVFAEEGIETSFSAENVLANGTWDFWTTVMQLFLFLKKAIRNTLFSTLSFLILRTVLPTGLPVTSTQKMMQ